MASPLRTTDPEVYDAIRREGRRQREKILLIASENWPRKGHSSQTSTQKGILAGATTAAVSIWTSSRTLLCSALNNCSERSM